MLKCAFGLILALCAASLCAQEAAAPKAKPAAGAPAGKRVRTLPIEGIPALARIDAKGTVRVGVAINGPWAMHDKSGQLIGYSVDVARKLAADLGWKLELVTTSWPRLIDDVRTDQYDLAISGISISPQRARLVAFSRAYGEHDIAVVVNRDKSNATVTKEFAKVAHARVAVRKGELTADYARSAFATADIVEVDDEEQAIADLRAGKVDAFVAEAPMPATLEHLYPKELRVLSEPIARTAHAIAMRRGEEGLRDVIDAWIIQSEASGWLGARRHYWFEGWDWADQL